MSAIGRRLPLARQGHDLVGCQAGGRAASHRLDETASSPSSTARLPQNNGIPTDAELDLGVRQNADSFTYGERYGHLAFLRDTHG
jgi:hypothetical protein